jgi:quinol monooxygenase YgiN
VIKSYAMDRRKAGTGRGPSTAYVHRANPTTTPSGGLGGGPDGGGTGCEHDPTRETASDHLVGRLENVGGPEAMVTVGLQIRLHAKPGKERDVADFLEGVMPLIQEEPGTTALFGLRFGPSEFGIFTAFADEAGRQAHINGGAAAALFGRVEDLFISPPAIEPVDIVAAKVPTGANA